MMKKILFVCNYPSPYGGNFIASISALNDELHNRNCKTVFIFPETVKQQNWCLYLLNRNFKVTFLDFRQNKIMQLKHIAKFAINEHVDVIHLNFIDGTFLSELLLFHPNIKIIQHCHSDFSLGTQSGKTKFINFIKYRFLRGRRNFIAVGEYLCRLNPKHSVFIPNALAANRDFGLHANQEDIRLKFNISKDDILCEVYGWSPVVKGVDIAVEAVRRLKEKYGKNVKLAIICGLDYNENHMKEFIKERTNCSGNEEFLVFLPPTDNVFSYHKAADVLLSPSRSEAFSYVLLEMLSLGKRAIISDVPGQTWALKYNTCAAFQTQNIDSLVEILNTILSAGFVQNQNVANAIEKDYNIQNWINTVIQQYGI